MQYSCKHNKYSHTQQAHCSCMECVISSYKCVTQVLLRQNGEAEELRQEKRRSSNPTHSPREFAYAPGARLDFHISHRAAEFVGLLRRRDNADGWLNLLHLLTVLSATTAGQIVMDTLPPPAFHLLSFLDVHSCKWLVAFLFSLCTK